MPRQPRLDVPGFPMHVVQRGNNRHACFFSESDYHRYLQTLHDAALAHQCRVHAYVLMSNHVHLLVTPDALGALSQFMQSLGRSYVAYVNARYERSGTLWEGRFKSCLVDSDRYVLACYRYIELNPVRAGMVSRPREYRWSSYRANALGRPDGLVSPHPCMFALAVDRTARAGAYRRLVAQGITPRQLAEIRQYVQQQRALGGKAFQARIEGQIGRCATARPQGRPRSRKKGI